VPDTKFDTVLARIKDIENMNDSRSNSFPTPLNRAIELISAKVARLE